MTNPQVTQDKLTPNQAAERKAQIVRLYDSGKTFTEIGDMLGTTKQYAHRVYWQAVAETPQLAVSEMRAQQNERLQWLMEQAAEVLTGTHYAYSGGTLLYGPAPIGKERGEPLLDSGPKLAAIREIRALVETQAKLNGTCAPAQVTVNGQISFVINNVDMGNLS